MAGVLVLAAACASEPKPFEAPALITQVVHLDGSLLAGARPTTLQVPATTQPERTLVLRCMPRFLRSFPEAALGALTDRTRLVASRSAAEPLRAAASLGRGARFAHGDPARAFQEACNEGEPGAVLPELVGIVSPEITALFRVTLTADEEIAGEMPLRPACTLEVSTRADRPEQLRFVLLLEGVEVERMARPAEDEAEPRVRDVRKPSREILVLDGTETVADGPWALVVRAPFPGFEDSGVAFLIEVASPTVDPETVTARARAVALSREAARAQSESDAKKLLRVVPGESTDRLLARGLEILAEHSPARRALVFLAMHAGAGLCEELALRLPDAALRELQALALQEAATLRGAPLTPDGLALALERAAIAYVRGLRDANALSLDVRAVVTRSLGSVALELDFVGEILAGCSGAREFHSRLVAENRYALEDGDPVVRLVAADWLGARGLAVESYDPLATPRERRAALERAATRAASRPAEGGGP